ncbi:MAG: preprotein translocase subunit SecY [bacterium]
MASLTEIRNKLSQIVKNKEIRDKVLFSLMILVVFRFMASVPVPGLPENALTRFFGDSGFGEVLTLVSGGVLENATIVAIGLGPYINASIIFQLLGSVIPKIEELQKEGEQGRRVISMYTRLLSVPLSVLQSFVIYSVLQQYGIMDKLVGWDLVNLIATLSSGAVIMMWMGELISDMGVGNGSSFLIMAGILAGIPGSLKTNLDIVDSRSNWILLFASLILVLVIVIVNVAERKVKIQYARRVRSTGASAESFIPLKINQSGVMPVIFALSMLSFPQLIGKLLVGDKIPEFIKNTSNWLVTQLNEPTIYNAMLAVMIIFFSIFYTFVVFNPVNIAENLQKQGAFIPGIRPGKETERYISKAALRLSIFGSVFLAVIAILPTIAQNLGLISSSIISGTGLLIVIGVLLDSKRQIESLIVTRSYESYL